MKDISRLESRRTSGWPTAMHLVPLGGEEILVHSPTWLGDDTFERVEREGTVRYLFAPNHFHHLSLARFRARFPYAAAIASDGATPRLEKRGHSGLLGLDAAPLPKGLRWLVPEGTKSGEAWLAIDGDAGTTWLVCDAFFNEPRPMRGFEGVMLRLGNISPNLCIGSTFTLLCIADKRRYREWLLDKVAEERPVRVLFSHGDPLEEDVPAALERVISARI